MKKHDMRKSNNNLKAATLYFIGNVCNKAIAFMTMPIFTRLLTTEEYGLASTYLSVVAILGTFITLCIGNTVRNAFVDMQKKLDEYISSIFFFSILSALLWGVLFFTISLFFNLQLSNWLVITAVLQAFMTCIIDTILVRYMMEVNYVKRTSLLAIPNVLVAALSVVLILKLPENKHFGRIFAYFIVYLFVGLYYLIKQFCRGKKFVSKEYWKYGLTLSVPLIFHGLSLVILAQADRTMITVLRNASETGIYSLVYNFSMVANAITTSMENVWIPWFTMQMRSQNRKVIQKNSVKYINFVTILIAMIILVAPEILKIMAEKEYWSGIYMIPPIVLASFFVFLTSFLINLEYYYKKTKNTAVSTLVSAIVNLILNYLFIPKYGAIAAAYTTVVAYIVNFIMHYCFSRKLERELFHIKIFCIPIIGMALVTIFSYVFMPLWYIRWLLSVILGIVILKFNWSVIKNLKRV